MKCGFFFMLALLCSLVFVSLGFTETTEEKKPEPRTFIITYSLTYRGVTLEEAAVLEKHLLDLQEHTNAADLKIDFNLGTTNTTPWLWQYNGNSEILLDGNILNVPAVMP